MPRVECNDNKLSETGYTKVTSVVTGTVTWSHAVCEYSSWTTQITEPGCAAAWSTPRSAASTQLLASTCPSSAAPDWRGRSGHSADVYKVWLHQTDRTNDFYERQGLHPLVRLKLAKKDNNYLRSTFEQKAF